MSAAVRDFIIIFSEQCSAAAAAAPVTALLSPVKYDHTSREQERASDLKPCSIAFTLFSRSGCLLLPSTLIESITESRLQKRLFSLFFS